VRALLRAGARPDLNLLAMDPAEAEQSLFPPVWKSTSELVVGRTYGDNVASMAWGA
jgi:hypothetical protein